MDNSYISLVGHVDHGKSTICRKLIERYGDSEQVSKYDSIIGNGGILDNEPNELERGITIDSHIFNLDYNGEKYKFVDLPGHADYINTAIKGLQHSYATILVISVCDGVMPQTKEFFVFNKTVWN